MKIGSISLSKGFRIYTKLLTQPKNFPIYEEKINQDLQSRLWSDHRSNTLSSGFMKGRVVAISLSKQRGVSKRNISKGYLKEGHGLDGDAHSGKGSKQISLLAVESIKRLNEEKKMDASPGDFAENITTEGVNLIQLAVGTRLKIGKAVIEVTQIGKDPGLSHKFSYQGHSLLPSAGIFARVIESGKVNPGDEILVLPKERKK